MKKVIISILALGFLSLMSMFVMFKRVPADQIGVRQAKFGGGGVEAQDIGTGLRWVVSGVHILPFFPSSSDRGFSIIAYEEVDPRLGSWDDIEELSLRFRLMFDGVFNHVSASSRSFQEFLNGNPNFQDFFIRFSTREAANPIRIPVSM